MLGCLLGSLPGALLGSHVYTVFVKKLSADCSDLDDIMAAHDSSWSDGSEHALMLFHPGCKPQRPIGPITLQTLAISQDKSATPGTEHQQQAAVGCGKTPVGCGRTSNPSENQQLGVAQLGPEQLSAQEEEAQAKSSGEHPDPDREAKIGHANPSRGQEEVGGSAAAEALTILVWVHPAAAREAWKTLKGLAEGFGIGCTSRSVETQYIPIIYWQFCKFGWVQIVHHYALLFF